MTPDIIQAAGQVAALVASGASVMLVHAGSKWLEAHTEIRINAEDQAELANAVQSGAGLIIKDLVRGAATKADLHTNSGPVSSAVNHVLSVACDPIYALGISSTTIANLILAEVGHALGQDPTVQTADFAVPVRAAQSTQNLPPANVPPAGYVPSYDPGA